MWITGHILHVRQGHVTWCRLDTTLESLNFMHSDTCSEDQVGADKVPSMGLSFVGLHVAAGKEERFHNQIACLDIILCFAMNAPVDQNAILNS